MVRTLFLAGALMMLAGAASPVRAASAWAAGKHSAARLLDAGDQGRDRLAGIEIRLDPGFITYWRNPGEAGVPPTFDIAGSVNVKDFRVDYPAPQLFDEDGTTAYGYASGVTLPVRIAVIDAQAPTTLDLALDYAVCSRICLPVKARLTLHLGAGGDGPQLRDALAAVPKPARLGEAGPARIDAVRWTGPATIAVEAHAGGDVGTLFVEAPGLWYFFASPAVPSGDGRLDFTLTGPDRRPDGPLPAEPLRLTLVSRDGAIEVPVPLDAVAPRP